MKDVKVKLWLRRLKRKGMWPDWLRNPCLLKWIIWLGVTIYRLWRWWLSLTGPSGS